MGERGQASAEYAGVLVLLAMGIGGLATSDLGDRVGGAVQTGVCRIVDPSCGKDEGPPAPVTRNRYGMAIAPRTMNADGPGADREELSFGWPGSSSFTLKTPKSGVRYKRTSSTGVPTPNASGCRMISASNRGSFEGYLNGAGVDVYRGKGTEYQVSLGPGHADRVKDGKASTPNPFDPRTLAPGESATMTEETYRGLGVTHPISALRGTLGDEKGRTVASNVSRIDDRTMRLTVGDDQYVKRVAGLGVRGLPINLSGTDKVKDGKARSIDVDISTRRGWNVYQAFVRDGKLPAEGGVASNPQETSSVQSESAAEVGLDAGPLSFSAPSGSSGFTLERVTGKNGSDVSTRTWRQGDYSLQVVDTKGQPPKYVVMAAGADKGELATFRQQQGLPPGRPNDLRLEFTGPQMMALVDDAKLTDSSMPRDDTVFRDLRASKTPLDGLIALAGASTSKNGTSAVAGLSGITTRIAAAARRKGAKGVDGKLGGREPRVRCPR